MLHNLAFEDPDFDTANSISGHGFGHAIINIGAQCMQRHSALAIPFGTGNFSTAETATAIDTNAQSTQAHGRLHGALHGATETDTALKLLRDAFCNQLCINLRFTHFNNVQHHFAIGHFADALFQLLNVSAFFTDDDTGAGRVNGDAAFFMRALNHHARNTGLTQVFEQHGADFQIFMQQIGVFALICIPARLPSAVDAEAHANRINLLSHYAFSSTSRTTMVSWLNGFKMRAARPLARARKRFITKFLPT